MVILGTVTTNVVDQITSMNVESVTDLVSKKDTVLVTAWNSMNAESAVEMEL